MRAHEGPQSLRKRFAGPYAARLDDCLKAHDMSSSIRLFGWQSSKARWVPMIGLRGSLRFAMVPIGVSETGITDMAIARACIRNGPEGASSTLWIWSISSRPRHALEGRDGWRGIWDARTSSFSMNPGISPSRSQAANFSSISSVGFTR